VEDNGGDHAHHQERRRRDVSRGHCVISVITAAAVHEDAFALDSAQWRAHTFLPIRSS
jgi:hypothetical protein